jgi:hypothetical protein
LEAFKGNNFEKLIMHIIEDKVKDLKLKIVRGEQIEKRKLVRGSTTKFPGSVYLHTKLWII